MASFYTDLALYNREGRLIAVAEVKNKQGTSSEWAAKFRRNLFAHNGYSKANFLLLATPDRLYFWKDTGVTPSVIQPTYEIDAQPIFSPYFEKAGVSPRNISEQAFELVVAAWLGDLVRSEEPQEPTTGQGWLRESGFLMAVRDCRIAYEEAA